MPRVRNVQIDSRPRRLSARYKQDAITYDQNGWQIPNINYAESHQPCTVPSNAAFTRLAEEKTAPRPHYQKPAHIPRPRNPFICFRSAFYKQAKRNSSNASHDQNDISIRAGAAWKAMSSGQKKPYQDMAKNEKLEHQAKYPGYTYSPGNGTSQKRKLVRKRRSPSKLPVAEVENPIKPIVIPALPRLSPLLEDNSSITCATPSPQYEAQPLEMVEPPSDSGYPDSESPVKFDFTWTYSPKARASSSQSISPVEDEKKLEGYYDFSILPASYDAIPEALGDNQITTAPQETLDLFLPSPEDVHLFYQTSIDTSPVSVYANWDAVTQTMSSENGGYSYVDFDQSHALDSSELYTNSNYGIWSMDDSYATTDFTSYSIPEDEELEMSRYLNYNYN